MFLKRKKVKLRRVELDLTQKQLREMIKISPTTLIKIERGIYDGVTYSQMQRIAKALNCTVTELFFPEELEKEV